MDKPFKRLIYVLYGPFFAVIDFFIRSYKANRDRMENLKSSRKVSSFIQNAAIVILLAWTLIYFLAPEGSGDRLAESFKRGFEIVQPPTRPQGWPE